MNNYPARPVEHLHSMDCLFDAAKTALENIRDDIKNNISPNAQAHAFKVSMQYNHIHDNAMSYLEEGLTICRCPECPHSCCSLLEGTGEDITLKEDRTPGRWVYGDEADYDEGDPSVG